MKTVTFAACLVLLFVDYAPAQEPNWSNRYQDIKRQLIADNPPPTVGTRVSILRAIGGGTTGTLQSITSTQVVISGVAYTPRQLAPTSRDELFPVVAAIRTASQLVLEEQAAYRAEQARAVAEAAVAASSAAEVAQTDASTKSAPDVAPAPLEEAPKTASTDVTPSPAATQAVASTEKPLPKFPDSLVLIALGSFIGMALLVGGAGMARNRVLHRRAEARRRAAPPPLPMEKMKFRKKTPKTVDS